jgi:hypothetical protein
MKYKLTIIVETTEEVHFALYPHDVIDGFDLTRSGEGIAEEFKIKSGYILRQDIIEDIIEQK